MKKVLAGLIIFLFVAVFSSIQANAESSLAGVWKQIEDQGVNKGKVGSHIEMFEKNGIFYGKIVKLLLDPPDKICPKCPGELKNKLLVGMIIMKDMKKTGKIDKEQGIEYAGGTIVDPDSGDVYKCKMWLKDDVLTVRGFIGISLLGRSAQWFRLK